MAKQMNNNQARKKLIEENLPLVPFVVRRYFPNSGYEKEELIAVGSIGLIKSIDSFDASKGYKFSTFAVLLIIREIASFMRKNNKYLMTESLDKTISLQEEKIQYTSMDTLKEPSNTENDYINQEIYRTIHSIVASLPLKDRQIIEMYFGFHDQEPMRQSEIANVMHVSQSLISRKIKQNVEKISVLLQEAGIIEEQKQSRLKKS